MGDRDGGGGAAESYARKRQYDYNAVRIASRCCWLEMRSIRADGEKEKWIQHPDAMHLLIFFFTGLPVIRTSRVTGSLSLFLCDERLLTSVNLLWKQTEARIHAPLLLKNAKPDDSWSRRHQR